MKVTVQHLKRHFHNVRAVDDVSFSFGSGDVCGFVGPNGAGKTTTMRVMATLDDPTAGDVLLDAVSVIDHPEEGRRLIGFVPDSLPEYADMTVYEYLDFFARAYGLRGAARCRVVDEVQAFTGVTGLKDRLVRQLSKGMKQRVCLGRALVHDPQVLILDEPASGLDPRARVELRELLFLLARRGKAVFISSHILAELTEICNTVVIIEHGRLVENGSIAEITQRNRTTHRVAVRVAGDAGAALALAHELPGVERVLPQPDGFHLELSGAETALAGVLQELVRRGCAVIEFRLLQDDLEDVFMRVTKGEVA
jgi:ABC-2 type transport system ATP-binding protein